MFKKIRDFFTYKKLKGIKRRFNKNKDFNVKSFDKEVADVADKIYARNKSRFLKYDNSSKGLGVIASVLFNNGGHSACIFNFLKSFSNEYETSVFLTAKNQSVKETCNQRINLVTDYASLNGVDSKDKKWVDAIISLYNQIVAAKVKALFIFIATDDVIAAAVLHLLKEHTDVGMAFFNHADHYPVLGMASSDAILEFRPAMIKVTEEVRGYDNIVKTALQAPAKDDTVYFSYDEIASKLKELDIKEGEYFTVTGCASYKIFDGDKSDYLNMIRDLLADEPNLKHVLVTNKFDEKQQAVFDKFMSENEGKLDRFKVIPFDPKFDILFQSCDLFIDSFPQGSALTHVDMMRNKRPTVVKIDRERPERSFECYLPDNYEFAFEKPEDMKKGVLSLLKDTQKQRDVVEKLYQHYLDNFEFNAVKNQYNDVIKALMK